MRASTAGVLDRALDVAAALEVRGYGAARQRARGRRLRVPCPGRATTSRSSRRPASCWRWRWSHASPGWARFHAYPRLRAPAGARTVSVAAGRWWWRRWRRSPTVGGSSDEPGLDASELTYTLPGGRGAGARRRVAGDRAGRVRRDRGVVGLGQVDAAAGRSADWCRTSTAAPSPGSVRVGGLDTRDHGPGGPGGAGGHAVPGSRDAGRDRDTACRARLRGWRTAAGPRRRSRARSRRRRWRWRSSRCSIVHVQELSAAASCSGSRWGRRSAVAPGARLPGRADLTARSGRRRRADRAAAAPERGRRHAILLAEHRLERCLARGRPGARDGRRPGRL